jgi:hypothetical protein
MNANSAWIAEQAAHFGLLCAARPLTENKIGEVDQMGYSRYLFKRSVALVPPNPKELERT